MTDTEAVLQVLKSGRSLTPIEALRELGVFRLAARVWDLKALGHRIEVEMVRLPSGKKVARYRYTDEPEQLAAGF